MKKLSVLLILCSLLCLFAACGPTEEKKTDINIPGVSTYLFTTTDWFSGASIMDFDRLELKYDVDLSGIEEGVICLPSDAVCANMLIICKAKEGMEKDVFSELGMLVKKYDLSWTANVYNAEEAQKVTNKTIKKIGSYYICVISDDNQAVLDIILN